MKEKKRLKHNASNLELHSMTAELLGNRQAVNKTKERNGTHEEENEKVIERKLELVGQGPGPENTSKSRTKSPHERS